MRLLGKEKETGSQEIQPMSGDRGGIRTRDLDLKGSLYYLIGRVFPRLPPFSATTATL